jgi:hypothetical protein
MGLRKPKTEEDIALERTERVSSLYRRGKSYRDIAETLGITLGQVSNDMKRCRKLWRQRASRSYAAHLYEQLAKLDELESAAWVGWERSLRDELVTGTEDGETPMGKVSKTRVSRVTKSGNASFLKIINDTVRQRCELLGLLDPDSRGVNGDSADDQVVSVVIETRDEATEFKTMSLEQYRETIATGAG